MADLGPATDVYGLGATLYELLTGEPPFLAESLQQTRDWALTRPPKPLAQAPGVPPHLAAVCERCLDKDPARRYASAAAFADDLTHAATHAPRAEWAGPSGFRLRVSHAGGRVQVYPLPERRVLIGRSAESDIALADDHRVSRSHCALNWDGARQTFALMDFGAVNGTYVNGETQRVVGRRELVPGDVLRLGNTRMVFEGEEGAR